MSDKNLTELTDAQRQELHTKLLEDKKNYEGAIVRLNEELKETQEFSPDPIDQAAVVERRNSILAQINQTKSSILKVEKALENFDDFGWCEECGEDIEYKRIMNNPTVTTCISCQTEIELKEKQMRG